MPKKTDKNPASTMTMLLGGANSAATNPAALDQNNTSAPDEDAADVNRMPQGAVQDADDGYDEAPAHVRVEAKKLGRKPNPEKSISGTYTIYASNVDKIDAVSSISRKPIKDIVNEALADYFNKNAELVNYCMTERERLARAIKKKFS